MRITLLLIFMSVPVKRTLYHTHLKYLAHENLLPHDILSQIPKSTRYRWTNENPLRYETLTLNLRACEDYQTIFHFAHNKRVKRIYAACLRITKFVLKTAKYYYLYRMSINNRDELTKAFAFTVQNFNERPHISLDGLTPNEAERNITLDKEQLRTYIKTATEERKRHNQSHRCSPCKK